VSLTVSLPDMNDETSISIVSMGLNCESKPSSTCGRPMGLKCYRCGNSEGMDGHFVVNKETGFLIGVLNNARDDTKYEIRTDGKARDVQPHFRYRGVAMKDVTISVGSIPVPNERGIPVTLGPNEHRVAVREAYAPVRSSEALPTKRTNVDRVGRALVPASDDGSVVDLLYYFSHRAACQWLEKNTPCTIWRSEDQSQLETMVGLINAYGNTALSDSEIPTSFNVVKVHVDVTYDEGTISASERLDWVTESVIARNLRDEYKADLVVDVFYLMQPTGGISAEGVGWAPFTFPNRSRGYSSSGGSFELLDSVITHEIGHNFGARHDRFIEKGGVPDESFYGHINCNQCFSTIMSYPNACAGKCNSGVTIIPYFSNPDLKYEGFPMGDNENNNALQLSLSAPAIAINRYSFDKSIFSPIQYYFTNTDMMALKFDIVPKKNLILKNIELEVTNNMEISVYIVKGPFTDDMVWGSPWVTETLTPLLSNLNSEFRKVTLYDSFPDKSLDANQVYAIRIERQDNDMNERMAIATPGNNQDGGYLFENNDVTVNSGRVEYFNGYESLSVAGLRGGLIYIPSEVPTEVPTASPVETTCEDNKKVQFKIGKKKKKTKCKKIKLKHCNKKYKMKKVDGVKKGKPKDYCLKTCNPTKCCIDGTALDYKIMTKEGTNVIGKYSCLEIKDGDYCKGKLQTGKKLKDVCNVSCGRC